jgi:hypothetical protein
MGKDDGVGMIPEEIVGKVGDVSACEGEHESTVGVRWIQSNDVSTNTQQRTSTLTHKEK